MIELFDYQKGIVNTQHTALYWKMGRGKTYGGLDRADQYDSDNLLIVCQKSKIDDWIEAVDDFFGEIAFNLRKSKEYEEFLTRAFDKEVYNTGVINYDMVFRKKELLELHNLTLILDESSLLANPNTKRTKFIRKIKADHRILLSGTPDKGKYEELVTQAQLLGWKITKQDYWDRYVKYRYNNEIAPIPIPIVYGYKHVDELIENLKTHGAHFLDEDETLPSQTDVFKNVEISTNYKKFHRNRFLILDDVELVGDTSLTQLLYERQLCGIYSKEKQQAFVDLLESCPDRVIVFYNFTREYEILRELANNRPISVINGKTKDLTNYKECDDSITFVQWQAGSMGLNLQLANYEVIYTPPLSSEQFEQGKKRIHRIGQTKTCFYYYLVCKESVEEKIYKVLKKRRDYSAKLFGQETEV